MPVLWMNSDDSPHQITVTTGSVTRSAVLAKGARHTQSFSTPGVYDYMCGLHPAMKGQLEVKQRRGDATRASEAMPWARIGQGGERSDAADTRLTGAARTVQMLGSEALPE